MIINRDNYQAYFLDFVEGKLSPEQSEMLHRFLKFNPDLADEFDELQTFRAYGLIPEPLEFPAKELLKKRFPSESDAVTWGNFDMYCIAYLENDLSEKQRRLFEKFMADHPEAESQFATYKFTFLKQETVLFPSKEQLKHSRKVLFDRRILIPFAAAAAVAVYIIISVPEPEIPVEIASVTMVEENKTAEHKVDSHNKPAAEPAKGNVSVIRSSAVPVPISTYKKRDQEKREEEQSEIETGATENGTTQVLAMNIQHSLSADPLIEYDRLTYETIPPISVNRSSLSIFELARYRAQRAAEVIEEEDALLWSIASAGIKGLNRISIPENVLLASRDEDGAISGFRFRSRFLNVTAPLNRDED
jgi:hypothetical protein